MSIIKPPVLPAWADAGDKTQPTDPEITVGWPASSVPPSRQRFNWVLNFCANAVRYFSRRSITDYDAAETYSIGDKVIGDDGNTYTSLVNSNINHTPSTSPTQWEFWATSVAASDDANGTDASRKLATTNWLKGGFALNMATPTTAGYLKFPKWLGGGLILQWGNNATSGSAPTTITLPIAWSNGYIWGAGNYAGGGSNSVVVTIKSNAATPLTKIDVDMFLSSTGGRTSTAGLPWLVLGY